MNEINMRIPKRPQHWLYSKIQGNDVLLSDDNFKVIANKFELKVIKYDYIKGIAHIGKVKDVR